MRKAQYVAFLLISLVLMAVSYPQPAPPAKAAGWTRGFYEIKYGGKLIYPQFSRVLERPKGDLIAVGANHELDGGWHKEYDVEGVILVVNSAGAPLSVRTMGAGGTDEYLYGAINTTDGGVLLYGCTATDATTARGWVVKLDSSWKISWQKMYGKKGMRLSTANAHEMKDRGFILLTESEEDFLAAYIMKISSKGVVQWQKKIPEPDDFNSFGVSARWSSYQRPTPVLNDSIFILGMLNTPVLPYLSAPISVLKLNDKGVIERAKWYLVDPETTFVHHPRSLIATADGGALVGFMLQVGVGIDEWSPCAMKIDSKGLPIWTVKVDFKATPDPIGNLPGAYPAPNDGAIIFTDTKKTNEDSIISISKTGEPRFARGWSYYNEIYGLEPYIYTTTREGGYVGARGNDIWKWDRSGLLSSDCKLSAITAKTSIPSVTESDLANFPKIVSTAIPLYASKMTLRTIGVLGMKVTNNCKVTTLKRRAISDIER